MSTFDCSPNYSAFECVFYCVHIIWLIVDDRVVVRCVCIRSFFEFLP